MPPKLAPFLHRQITRHGKAVWYFRKGKGRRVRIPGEYGSAQFLAAYDAALGGHRAARKSPASGSFAWGLSLYRQSQTWGALSPATRRQRDNIFAKIAGTHGETSLRRMEAGRHRGRKGQARRTPTAARHFVEALRGMFRWLVESGLVASDPTIGITVVKPKSEGFAAWTRSSAPAGLSERARGSRSKS